MTIENIIEHLNISSYKRDYDNSNSKILRSDHQEYFIVLIDKGFFIKKVNINNMQSIYKYNGSNSKNIGNKG